MGHVHRAKKEKISPFHRKHRVPTQTGLNFDFVKQSEAAIGVGSTGTILYFCIYMTIAIFLMGPGSMPWGLEAHNLIGSRISHVLADVRLLFVAAI